MIPTWRNSASQTTYTTALSPKDGTYLLPLKVVVRKAEGIDLDDVVAVRMRLGHEARGDA